MALPIAKLTILVGAGLVGSMLAKEGRISDFVSGAFKIAVKQIHRKDDSSSSSNGKPQNESLLAQVNSLRQELQLLASDKQVTIITGSRSGASTFGPPVVIVIVVGYGFIWWKGWKISDMMFATKRSLNEARTSVAKQLDQVFSTITVTEKRLSSRITDVDSNIDECARLTSATGDQVNNLHGEVKTFSKNVQEVRQAVKTLETKIGQIEEKQDITTKGVNMLCDFTKTLENGRTTPSIQASPSTSRAALELPQATPTSTASPSTSRPALELPKTTPTSRVLLHANSMPPGLLCLEIPSPSIQASSSISPKPAPEHPEYTPTARTSSLPPQNPSPSSSNAGAATTSGRFGWFFRSGSSR